MDAITKIPKDIIDLYGISYKSDGDKKAMYVPMIGGHGMMGIFGSYKLFETKNTIRIDCTNGTTIELMKDIKNILITI